MSDKNPITKEALAQIITNAKEEIINCSNFEELKEFKTNYMGEKSKFAFLSSQIRNIDPSERAESGKIIGQAKAFLNDLYSEAEKNITDKELYAQLEAEKVDISAYPNRNKIGARHPINLLQEKIADIFIAMGWEVAEGPELENEWFNFDALNFEADHPAREMQDTFFVEPQNSHLLLRTHTSPVQIRSLLERELPLYIIAPGKVYRTDELDATHTPVFHQIEGIAIDENLSMAHLKGTLEHFARQMFGKDAKIRLRPNYFPFTEPSAELDVWHPNAKGGAKWIEWGGCGMVNRNVLKSAGIDSDKYQGFAFGMGVERTLQFRYDLNDMRDMVEGDIRFSLQFGTVV